jgi:ABC-type multidrug transport system fused ATPase/permease subunit
VTLVFIILGKAFVPGFIFLCINTVIVERLADRIKQLTVKKLGEGDKRNVLLNEAFQGIRTVKLYGWEPFVEQRVQAQREEELSYVKRWVKLQALQSFCSFGMPTLAMVGTFIFYAKALPDDEIFDPAIIFMTVSLFEFLNEAMAAMPQAVSFCRQVLVSIDRIEDYLAVPEDFVPLTIVEGKGGVTITGGNFKWAQIKNAADAIDSKTKKKKGEERAAPTVVTDLDAELAQDSNNQYALTLLKRDTLRNIDFSATGAAMVAVVGKVGSGKSTLAAAMPGLVGNCGGTVEIGGRTAYVAQQACILNDTVRENILFGDEYDEKRYQKVIEVCALGPDIAAFNAEDQTEIGEKGITISGGQRQRISIARAAYSRTEIAIFDDPLSAMDAHVGRIVFEKTFTKTTPLTTAKTNLVFINTTTPKRLSHHMIYIYTLMPCIPCSYPHL